MAFSLFRLVHSAAHSSLLTSLCPVSAVHVLGAVQLILHSFWTLQWLKVTLWVLCSLPPQRKKVLCSLHHWQKCPPPLVFVLLSAANGSAGLFLLGHGHAPPSKESSLHRAGCPLSFQEMHCPLSCWLFFHFEKTLLSQRLAGASS